MFLSHKLQQQFVSRHDSLLNQLNNMQLIKHDRIQESCMGTCYSNRLTNVMLFLFDFRRTISIKQQAGPCKISKSLLLNVTSVGRKGCHSCLRKMLIGTLLLLSNHQMPANSKNNNLASRDCNSPKS